MPASATEIGPNFFLVNRAAHSTQYVGNVRYDEQSIGHYDFIAGTDHLSTKIVSGTYDVLMQRGASNGDDGTSVYKTDATDTLPNGSTLLMQNVVLTGAAQALSVDIPTATLSVTVTQDGAAMPATATEIGPSIVLIDRSTGATQFIGNVRYDEQSIGHYNFIAGTDHFSTLVVAGTYDVLLQRGGSTSRPSTYVYKTDATDTIPNGSTLLMQNVAIASGAQSLHLDLPTTHLSVALTLNGAALPATAKESGPDFFLVDRSTGATQFIGSPRYDEQSIGVYNLVAGTDHLATYVPAGTYDVLMKRGATTDDLGRTYVYRTDASDTLPDGAVLLQQNVTLAAGAQSLAIDVPATTLSVNVTVNGAALPTTATESGPDFLLVNKTTGAVQYIGSPRYDEQNIGQYTFVAGTDHFSTLVTSGTYDVLMKRGSTASSTSKGVYVYRTDASDTLPNGYALLQQNVVIQAAAQTLDIDIPTNLFTLTVVLDFGSLPTTATEDGPDFFLVDRTTGAVQYLGSPRYDEQTIGQYDLVTGTETFSTLVTAGTYDVLMKRGSTTNSDGSQYVYKTDDTDTLPNGNALVLQTVTLVPGTTRTGYVNIPATTLSGHITFNGAPLPAVATENGPDFFIVNRSTQAKQYIGGPRYDEQSIGDYDLVPGTDAYTSLVVSGTYDLLMQRGSSSSSSFGTYVYKTDTGDSLPDGSVFLGRCLYVP